MNPIYGDSHRRRYPEQNRTEPTFIPKAQDIKEMAEE